jgi:hypothetical protein
MSSGIDLLYKAVSTNQSDYGKSGVIRANPRSSSPGKENLVVTGEAEDLVVPGGLVPDGAVV